MPNNRWNNNALTNFFESADVREARLRQQAVGYQLQLQQAADRAMNGLREDRAMHPASLSDRISLDAVNAGDIDETFYEVSADNHFAAIDTNDDEEPALLTNIAAGMPDRSQRTESAFGLLWKPYIKDAVEDENGMITTCDGKKHLKSECICLEVNGRWYSIKDAKIFLDEVTEKYCHNDYAYVAWRSLNVSEKGKFKVEEMYVSKFTHEILPRVYSEKHGFDAKILKLENITGWDYKEDMHRNIIVDAFPGEQNVSTIKYYEAYKNKMSQFPRLSNKAGSTSQTYLATEGLKYTFGVEIEVNRGNVPVWMAATDYNMMCVRDGSINGGDGGPEYVTGVLVGDNGVRHLQEICNVLSKRTTVDKSCGVHLHLGSINFSRKFLINSYRLAMFLEDEIFSTLPKSRRSNTFCKKLKSFDFKPAIGGSIEMDMQIEEDYNTLFKHISYKYDITPSRDYNKKTNHPMGAKCGYEHSTPRYCWLNYVPAMFDTRGNKGYSIEVRSHGGTTNFTKIRNWLLFFMAFMSYVEKYPHLIVPGIKMKDVLDAIMPKKAKSLNIYFNSRKELFSIDASESVEYTERSTESFKNIKELILE